MADEMKSWGGARLDFKGWWAAKKGDSVSGILLQRNRNPGGRVNTPFYVLQLTKACIGTMRQEKVEMTKGDNIAVPENANLAGLDELLGYEVIIKVTDVKEFTTDDGEVREIKQFDVKHSAEVKNLQAASRYRPEARR